MMTDLTDQVVDLVFKTKVGLTKENPCLIWKKVACVCVERKHVNLHSSHCLPLNPTAQSQMKEPPPFTHVPPFWQGRLRQSWGNSKRQQLPLTSTVQNDYGSQVSDTLLHIIYSWCHVPSNSNTTSPLFTHLFSWILHLSVKVILTEDNISITALGKHV